MEGDEDEGEDKGLEEDEGVDDDDCYVDDGSAEEDELFVRSVFKVL